MNETVPAKYSNRVLAGIQHYIKTQSSAFVRRVAVVLLLLYFAVMVDAGSHVHGDLESGFNFPHAGYGLFPFPFPYSGGINLPMVVYFDPLLTFIYVVFIGQWIWIAWMSLGIIYIIMPIVQRALSTMRRPNMKSTHTREDVGVLTKLVVVLVVLPSVITYSINLEYYGPLPLILVLAISTVLLFRLFKPEPRSKIDDR